MFKRKHAGFTIIEMMVTVVVASILYMIAAPNMRNILLGNRLTAQTNTLVASLQFARSEAVKRATTVSIAPLGGTKTATTWGSLGWQVFVDFDSDGEVDAGDILLRTVTAMASGSDSAAMTVNTSPLTYRSSGNVITAMTAKICNTQYVSPKNERQVAVSLVGTVQTTETSNAACT